MKISIDSTIEYAGRAMGIISVNMPDKNYKIGMYRSTGRNVRGGGMWFPSAGLVAGRPQISKDMLLSDGDSVYKLPTSIRTQKEHSDPDCRLNAFQQFDSKNKGIFSFDMKELSASVEILFNQMRKENKINHLGSFTSSMSQSELNNINHWMVEGIQKAASPINIKTALDDNERVYNENFLNINNNK